MVDVFRGSEINFTKIILAAFVLIVFPLLFGVLSVHKWKKIFVRWGFPLNLWINMSLPFYYRSI